MSRDYSSSSSSNSSTVTSPASGEVLEGVRLFDVHSGPQVPEGKKSLAFSLRLRASDRTLTDEEIAKVRHEGVGAVLRA